MKAVLNSLRRFSLTAVMVLVAIGAGYKLWDYYMNEPWTRDGHVRADVVPVAPDVSGFVTEVLEGQSAGQSRRRAVPNRPCAL